MIRELLPLAVLALLAPVKAQIGLISRPVPPAEAVERGEKAFVANCGFCHGPSAKGGEGGPDLVRSVIVLDDEKGDQIGPVILKGRPDRGMPSFSMSEAQIADISAFLRARTQATINRREYKVQNLATGDAKAGQAFFNGAGKCNTCHSPTGDLAGVGAKYQPEALQSRFLYPRGGRGGSGPPTMVTVTPRSGPAISGTLEYIDDFLAGVRDADGYYHSLSQEGAKVEIRDPFQAHIDLLRRYTDAEMHNILAYLVTLK